MAPRSAMSFSTTSSSLYTEDVPPSIDVISLDDPSKMSPQAIKAELQYYGVTMPLSNDRQELARALVFARRNSNSGGSSPKGKGGSGGRGSGGTNNNRGSGNNPQRSGGHGSGGNNNQQQQYEPQQQRPGTSPQHHLQATAAAAKVPGMRVTPPNSHLSPHHIQPTSANRYSNGSGGNNPTHIPLTPQNRIPSQILNIIRTSADPSMKAINLDFRNLGDAEVKKLAEVLERNRTITFLSLRDCSITDEGVSKLGNMLLRNSTLVELHLDQNRIGAEGAAALSTSLITNETLAVLTLNDNPQIGDKGVVYLIGALEHNTTLRTLDMHNCGIQHDSGNYGNNGSLRSSRNRLEQIDKLLEDRQIDSNFESLLERLLDDDFRVTGIDLSGRRIGNRGAVRLAEALADNTQVRQLWLRGCNLGNDGARALASCIEQNMAIVDLFLGNNAIGNDGLIAISDALALSNLTLVSLELDDNRVGEGGLDAFLRALERNTSVLVSSFDNNPIGNSGKLEMLQATLEKKRNNLNLVSFVVDPDAASTVDGGGNDSGLVNMSVCSSYMPSTYRRAGFTSVTNGGGPDPNNLTDSGNSRNLRALYSGEHNAALASRSSGSHKFSIYNRANSRDHAVGQGHQAQVPPPRPPPPPPPPMPRTRVSPPEQKQQYQQAAMVHPQAMTISVPKEIGPPVSHKSSSNSSPKSGSNKSSSYKSNSSPPPTKQIAPQAQQSQQQPSKKPLSYSVIQEKPKQAANNKPKVRTAKPRPASPPPSRSNMYERAQVPVPLKAQALEPIAEQSSMASSAGGDFSSRISSIKSGRVSGSHQITSGSHNNKFGSSQMNGSQSNKFGSSQIGSSNKHSSRDGHVSKRSSHAGMTAVTEEVMEEEPELAMPLVRKRSKATLATEITDSLAPKDYALMVNLQHPQTQRNFNQTLKKLWRRVEMMKRTNHFAAAHYKARHFWFWFVPISGSIFMAILLSLASAIDVSGKSKVGLALFTGFFSLLAFCLNFLQSKFGWSSRSDVHRSSEVELSQVAFRLDTLGKYEGRGLTAGSHSTRSRANAIRDLYRIDVYLQAMQRCTPAIPEAINEVFYLLASRLKGICLKYPNAVKLRSAYAFYDEEPSEDNPVPVEMQIDALDLLGREIENYFLYPLFMPNARDVVSRTIDIFFAKPEEGGGGQSSGGGGQSGGGEGSEMDSQSYYSEDQTEIV